MHTTSSLGYCLKPILSSSVLTCMGNNTNLPQRHCEQSLRGHYAYPAGAAKKIARSLDTLKKQLTQSGKEVFIYELLQNANDYPRRTKIDGKIQPLPVDVEFHITENYLHSSIQVNISIRRILQLFVI